MIHKFLARFSLIIFNSIKLRNQLNGIIKYYLSESCNSHSNGEFAILRSLSGKIASFIDVGPIKESGVFMFYR